MQCHRVLLCSVLFFVSIAFAAQVAPVTDTQQNLVLLGRFLSQAADYDYGKSRIPLVEIERLLPKLIGQQEQRAAEQRLIARLKTASPGLRDFLCRQLGYFGSEASIEPLVALLGNADAAGIAVKALGELPGDAVARRLREVLPNVPDNAKGGIIFILGARRDQAALSLLSGFLTGANAELAKDAALAIGKIGTPEALQALGNARGKASADLRRDIVNAQLICAGLLASSGNAAGARALYAEVRDANLDPHLRAEGLRGSVLADPSQAGKLILAALQSKNEELIRMAVSLADRVTNEGELKPIAQALPSLSAPSQMRLLGALERRDDRSVLPLVIEAMKTSDEGVLIAALRAAAVMGDASAVEPVAAAAAGGGEVVQPVARQTLERMPGVGVNPRIAELLSSAPPASQVELARAAGARGIAEALPALRKAAAGGDGPLRAEAIRSLGKIGLAEDQPDLVSMLASNPSQELEDAVVAIAGREKAIDPLVAAAESARDAKARTALMQPLGRLGDARGMAVIQEGLRSSDWAIRTGAVRALALWPSLLPAEQLYQIAVTDDDLPRHIAALHGYMRMAVEARNRPVQERLAMIEKAISVARRVEEKRQGISYLADIPSMEAVMLAASYASIEELRPTVQAVMGRISMRYAGPNDLHMIEALLGFRIYTSAYSVSRSFPAPRSR